MEYESYTGRRIVAVGIAMPSKATTFHPYFMVPYRSEAGLFYWQILVVFVLAQY